jgi:uncharacterized protein YndB with AHSA1/START domain
MTRTIVIAPVRKSVLVNVPRQKAFDVFTGGVDRWWPKTHGIGSSRLVEVIIEPYRGGRWFGRHEDGSEVSNGHVLAWEPPGRVVFSWEINSQWKPDTSVASEVEVRFIAEGAATRVELEHRKFEVLGQEGGEKMRKDVDGGWTGILDLFKKTAETEG